MLKKFLAFILKTLSRLILWRYKPVIIGVTGNVGKTSTKEAIFAVLSSRFRVRRSIKNYNNEIGVPLMIIGQESAGRSIFGWLKIFLSAMVIFLFKTKKYPKILILEMGADRPGDIRYLTKFVHCQLAVVTAVGQIPVHIEFFRNPEHLAKEKAHLVSSLPEQGIAILNYDDPMVLEMAKKTKAKTITFGLSKGADVVVSDISHQLPNFTGTEWAETPAKVFFKINYEGSTVPFSINNVLGDYQIRPVLAAAAVGLTFEMNLVEISNLIKEYQPLPGRMRLLAGIKNTLLIDDSYNASPKATLAALETLNSIKAQRKIVILGDMLELGRMTEKAHRLVGQEVAKIADLFFAVGPRMSFAAEEAKKQEMLESKIFCFDSSQQAKKAVQQALKEGDVVLIKGSQAMRMEKITEEIMAEPERAKELLVRQDKEWKGKKPSGPTFARGGWLR